MLMRPKQLQESAMREMKFLDKNQTSSQTQAGNTHPSSATTSSEMIMNSEGTNNHQERQPSRPTSCRKGKSAWMMMPTKTSNHRTVRMPAPTRRRNEATNTTMSMHSGEHREPSLSKHPPNHKQSDAAKTSPGSAASLQQACALRGSVFMILLCARGACCDCLLPIE